jgi:thiamine pyrophosphokinase
MKKCIIIANGKPPTKNVVKYFINKGFKTIICADGGANSAKKIKITPDYIIGDFDSIMPATVKHFKNNSVVLQYKRQNDTDVEKCLKFALRKKIDEVVLFGVTGDRLDHTICNLGIVIKFFDKIKVHISAENSFLSAFDKSIVIKSKINEIISLYAFDKKTFISSKGLKYPLTQSNLAFGVKESTSNVATSENVELKIFGGIVFVVRDFIFMKKHDLF